METKLAKRVRFLEVYAGVATVVLLAFVLVGAGPGNTVPRFGEIDVERINIIEADGKLRMVISNQERQHPGISNGKVIQRDTPRPPGMIFFNHLGDEMGGLIFGDNGEMGHFGSLTFDKVRNDQTVGFRYLEGDNGRYSTGLEVWQQPNIPGDVMLKQLDDARALEDEAAREAAIQALVDKGELTVLRLFLGKLRNDVATLEMRDARGNPRIRMAVAPDGAATLEFLDDEGKVAQRFPAS